MRKIVLFTGLLVFFFCAGSAMAQDVPWAELEVGYSLLHFNANNSIVGSGGSSSTGTTSANFNGASGSIAGNVNHWLGIVGDFGTYSINQSNATGNVLTYVFGPRISYNHGGRFIPFGQALGGGARVRVTPRGFTAVEINTWAVALGGGLDVKVSDHFGVRLAQVEYFMTKISDGVNNRQNNVRFSAGLIIRFGKRP